MSLFIRLSCEVLTDAKILAAGPEASWLWVRGLLYAKQHLTDGFVPDTALAIVGLGLAPAKVRAAAKAIVAAGLWEECEGGWRVPPERWARWQTTREEVEAVRAKRADAGRKGAAKRWTDGKSMASAIDLPSTRNAQSQSQSQSHSSEPEPGGDAQARAGSPDPARPGKVECVVEEVHREAKAQRPMGAPAAAKSASEQRDPGRPAADGVDAKAWSRACAIADAVEEASAPQMPVVDANGARRAMAAAMLVERASEGAMGAALRKLGMPQGAEGAWIELLVNEVALRWRTDVRLARILADLRKWPDGLYPARDAAGVDGRKACRIEEAARILKGMGVGLRVA